MWIARAEGAKASSHESDDALAPSEPGYEMHALYAWMTELLGALLGATTA